MTTRPKHIAEKLAAKFAEIQRIARANGWRPIDKAHPEYERYCAIVRELTAYLSRAARRERRAACRGTPQ